MHNGWQLDGDILTGPHGQIFSLHTLLAHHLNHVSGQLDLALPKWRGWRFRQQRLIPPGQTFASGGLAPHTILAIARELRAGLPGNG
ncbi:hypothetical protein EC912_101762 [Luteibacter rhizovicinus]|uniref:Uncharacterized protein n=1 Tax=Luteibacter rhizovicinus TaxID=242606 RepID=A0A4R3YX48_9GAMM|nr:hypothetical protein EC912_101762 [Luteibacter rhizovicinus]